MIGFFNFGFGSIFIYSQDFVIIFFCHNEITLGYLKILLNLWIHFVIFAGFQDYFCLDIGKIFFGGQFFLIMLFSMEYLFYSWQDEIFLSQSLHSTKLFETLLNQYLFRVIDI